MTSHPVVCRVGGDCHRRRSRTKVRDSLGSMAGSESPPYPRQMRELKGRPETGEDAAGIISPANHPVSGFPFSLGLSNKKAARVGGLS